MATGSNYARGHFAEKAAMLWLMLKGWWPVALNFRVGRGTGAGEVDLIMVRGRMIIFVEVKRRATLTRAMEAITIQNQVRVARAAAVFLANHSYYQKYQARFDAVLMSPGRWPKHLPDAWRVL